jgi:hypothetical protein
MSPVRRVKRIDALDPFAVVHRPGGAAASVVLQTAPDAEKAALAFYTERRRLTQNHVAGDLMVVRQGRHTRPLLWESLL